MPLADTTGGMVSRDVICLGGATLDRKLRTLHSLQTGTSNPVTGERAFGGVARNVCENLARLGVRTALATLVGDDESGRELVLNLATTGADVSLVATKAGHRTAEYIAVLDADGELAFGLADMAIFDAFLPADVERLSLEFAESRGIFADCNLPATVLAELIQRARGAAFKLVIDPVSVAKAARLPRDLSGIDLLVLNRDEAAAMLGDNVEPERAAQALRKCGAASVILTDGGNGLLAVDHTGAVHIPAQSVVVRDVTGAGDALIAAVIAGLIAGDALAEAAQTGTYIAAQTVSSAATVCNDLSPETLTRYQRTTA
jgi:pseudouridine kinase